jgi:hypothetical protein
VGRAQAAVPETPPSQPAADPILPERTPTAVAAPQKAPLPDLRDDSLTAAPLPSEAESLPEALWEEPPDETAPLQPAREAGSLLTDPRYKLVQEIFPGRLLSYQPSLGFAESGLTEKEAQSGVDLDAETSDADAKEV